MSETPEQTLCCRHTSRYLCCCPQGWLSHAMPDTGDEDNECECGKIVMTTERWKHCSGQTHVFFVGDKECSCRKRFAGVERV